MKKSTLIEIAAFVIAAVIAYLSYSWGDTVNRVGYAVAIGLVFCLPIGAIATGADPEYRKNATTTAKINLLLMIVVFPILYLAISDTYSHMRNYPGKTMIAWCSFLLSGGITYVIGKAIEYVINLFSKE
jgi:MFS family permease